MFTPNHVSVTVISGKNLTGKGKNGKNDAFVVIQLADKKFQTSIQKKSVSPYWEEECEFFYENKYSELILTVHHRNLLGLDEFLGQLRLPLDEVYEPPKSLNPNQRPPSRWFPLKGKSGKKEEHKYRGELQIRLLFSRKQLPVPEIQLGARSKSPSISSFNADSLERRGSMEKNATLSVPDKGLKKRDFMGSMPSLMGSQKLSRPPSPTGSIASSKKKKSLLSKLKQSASFHSHQDGQLEPPVVVGGSASARSSIRSQRSSTVDIDDTIQKRQAPLGPLHEDQTGGAADSTWAEPEDPEPVIRVQKRGGGVFSLGAGHKQRPASAVIGTDRMAVLPSRFTMACDLDLNRNVPNKGSPGPAMGLDQNLSTDAVLNANASKEELREIVKQQSAVINYQRAQIEELEEYIDRLLVRVMTTQPELLHNISNEDGQQWSRQRAGSVPFNTKRAPFPFSARK